jgi:hypothetical protein
VRALVFLYTLSLFLVAIAPPPPNQKAQANSGLNVGTSLHQTPNSDTSSVTVQDPDKSPQQSNKANDVKDLKEGRYDYIECDGKVWSPGHHLA